MPAKYTVVERKDPAAPELEGRYYLSNKSDGLIDSRELAEYIAQRSGVSVGHVQGIVEDLGEEIESSLLHGETVDLGPIGIMYMNVSGRGATSVEEYDQGMIERVYIHLRCRKKLLAKVKDIVFVKPKYGTPKTVEPDPQP